MVTIECNSLDEGLVKVARILGQDILSYGSQNIVDGSHVDTGQLLHSGELTPTKDGCIVSWGISYACIVGGENIVKTINGHKFMCNIKIGDLVFCKDGQYHKVINKMSKLTVKDKPGLIRIKCDKIRAKKGLITTKDHLYLTKKQNQIIWEEAQNLKVGDIIYKVRKNAWNKQEEPLIKKCIGCGKELKLWKNKQINWCSQKCYHKYTKHNHAQGKRWELTDKQVERLMGENNPSWKGGTTKLPYGPEWTRKLKRKIKERDEYICKECGLKEEHSEYGFHVHHQDGNKFNNNSNNLITLCPSCHGKQQWRDCELITINEDVFEEVKIIDFEKIDASKWGKNKNRTKLYDLTVEGDNSFICQGMIVHNSYVEYGREPGSRPPYEPIYEWCKRKLGLPDDEAKKVAWFICNKIEKEGIEPVAYARNAIDATIRKYSG